MSLRGVWLRMSDALEVLQRSLLSRLSLLFGEGYMHVMAR